MIAKCEAYPLQRLSLWESWRGAPERARMPEWKLLHSDPIALTKADAHRCVSSLFATGLPSPSPSVTPLPKGEALTYRATSYWTPVAQYGAKGRALLQRAAASGQRTLSSCRWPGQQGTTVHETDKLCSSRGNLTDMPRALPLGELARSA